MLSKIKLWIKSKFIVRDEVIIAPAKEATQQTDVRTLETIKRVRKSFEAQQTQMQARAMKAHDPSCKDVVACKKRKCFKFEPDKIVGESYEVSPRKQD